MLLAPLLILTACSSVQTTEPGPGRISTGALTASQAQEWWANLYVAYGGSTSAYEQIAQVTDCTEVQAKFDSALEDRRLFEDEKGPKWYMAFGYMEANFQRGEQLGCPGFSS